MCLIEYLVGTNFLKLIAQGKKIQGIIKDGGDRLLQHSSPELENYYSRPAFLQAIPNPLSQAVLCIFFIITYVCGAGGVLNYFELPPQIYVLLFFSPAIVMSVFIAALPWAIGRGYVWGLFIILYLYLMGLFLMVISFFFSFLGFFQYRNELRLFQFIPVQLVIFYLTRVTINGEELNRLVSYFWLKRIAQEAYKIRNHLTDRQKKR